jgi:hypothetical protein
VQSAALAEMALLNARVLLLGHLGWSLWAFTFPYIEGGYSYVDKAVDHMLKPLALYMFSPLTVELFIIRLKQVRPHTAAAPPPISAVPWRVVLLRELS